MRANLLLSVIGAVSAAVALLFAWGAAFTLGNHLFDWRSDKISVEWPTTLWVAAIHGVAAVVAAGGASAALKRRMRLTFWWLFALIAVTAWIFISIGVSRDDAAYLWIIIGGPVALLYTTLRTWRHLRTRRAG